MRFLCLHGRGINAEIFKQQTARICNTLARENEFIFINGNFAVDTKDNPILQMLLQRSGGESLAYSPNGLETDAVTARRLYRELQAYISANGPFDGLMGFSEGATLAASLMAEDHRRTFAGFKCAILFCATDMCRLADLVLDVPKIMAFGKDTNLVLVDVPTAHIWSSCDEFIDSTKPEHVASLCNSVTRAVYIHDLGHDVPGSLSDRHVKDVVRIIERVIEMAKAA